MRVWAVSSGVERHPHTVDVGGSNPPPPISLLAPKETLGAKRDHKEGLAMFELPKVERIRKWETLFIIHPERVDEKEAVLEKFRQIVQSKAGDVLKIDEWGMRKLAYPIEKKKQGYYVLAEFYGRADLPQELENFFRIDERVIRYIIVKLEDRYNPEKEAHN